MSTFFVNRPIVAMVISIIMVIVGVVALVSLPVAQYPNIVPPEINVQTTFTGADALTVEQSVAAPIEQQMSGVDNMTYMYSLNSNSGNMKMYVDFDVTTDPNTDQILAQMRVSQAQSQLPSSVQSYGITVQKSLSSPLLLLAVYSPNETYDGIFLANYATINLNDAMTRVPGIASVTVFGAGPYSMRLWVEPDRLARMNITVSEIIRAINEQNNVNPSGTIGGEPVPAGQEFAFAVRAQGRLVTAEEFADIVVRANPDGTVVRVSDVARIELGAQYYNLAGRLNGKPAALLGIYQLPGSNAVAAAKGIKALIEERRASFPEDLDVVIALDTTEAVVEGMNEIVHTLIEAMILVILVVFVFLQGWRPTLIPLLAVPVSLVGTFAIFPLLGFSINTLSLFGLVLAIGLVVDDAIVVVEAVEKKIEGGLSPREATLEAMREVSGPVMAIAVILAAVFIPTAFIPGITGRLYQQFAVTIAISVAISAFNALTLSPALAALLLKPRHEARGPLGWFYGGFNRFFGWITDGYVWTSHWMIRVALVTMLALAALAVFAGWFGSRVPTGFLPEEDQGYLYGAIQLPDASSQQRTSAVMRIAEEMILATPGVEYVSSVVGFSLLSNVNATYTGFFFITLKPWSERKGPELVASAIQARINGELSRLTGAIGFAFPPPAIPGIGTSGGFTFILQDRSGGTVEFLGEQTEKFIAAAQKRPELAGVMTTFRPTVPQYYARVDRDRMMKLGIEPSGLYDTLQCFMGGVFVNYFNRFGRQWMVFMQAEGDYRQEPDQVGRFFVRNQDLEMVPLSTLVNMEPTIGPEFTMRYNLYRSAQINGSSAPGYSSAQSMKALEEVFAETMPSDMGYGYMGMSFQEQQAQQGVSPVVIFGIALLFVFLILAGLYESWSLPFAVLLATPIAVAGAFVALSLRGLENNIYAQIGLVMLIGLAAKNAILIVEFAKLEYDKGKPLLDATLAGAKLRLRPILMTSFAFILGCVPLAIATGAGSISRQVLGTVVIGGMLAATGVAIFFIPVCFYVVERLRRSSPGSLSGDGDPGDGAPTPAAPGAGAAGLAGGGASGTGAGPSGTSLKGTV